MDIVDTQVHLNHIGSVDTGVAALDALGIAAVLFDEYTVQDAKGHVHPVHYLPNGALRPVGPNAEAAALRYPDRIGVLRRVDYRDPNLESVVRLLAAAPYVKSLRILLGDPISVDAFANGGFNCVFEAALRHEVPVSILPLGHSMLVQRYARNFPRVQMIIDHCGAGKRGDALSEDLLALGQFQNVAVKWSHAPLVFSSTSYPFADVIPLLKRTLATFGPERVMWASDCTEAAMLCTWAETLFYLRDSAELTESEKEWILGRAARAVYRWPVGKPPRA